MKKHNEKLERVKTLAANIKNLREADQRKEVVRNEKLKKLQALVEAFRKEKKGKIKKLITLITRFEEWDRFQRDIKFPDVQKVQVLNGIEMPEVQKVHIVNGIEMPDIQKVQVMNATQAPDVQKVEVIKGFDFEMPEIQKVEVTNKEDNSWVPTLITHAIKGITEGIAGMMVKLWSLGITVKLDDSERNKPLPVIMVDIKGNPISPTPHHTRIPMMFSGGTSGQKPPTKITSGRVPVVSAGTRVQFPSQVCRKVIITALSGNGGSCFVGDATASAVSGSESGNLLLPTGSVTIDIDNANKIYVDSDHSGDVVTYNILT